MNAATDFQIGQQVEIVPKARTWVSDSQGTVTGHRDGYVTVEVGSREHQFWPGYLRAITA